MVMEATYEVAANRSLFVISHRCLYSRHHQHHNDGRSLLNLQVISDRMLLSTASDKTLPAETNRSRTLHWIRIILLHWRYAYNFLLWLTIVVALAMEIILTLTFTAQGSSLLMLAEASTARFCSLAFKAKSSPREGGVRKFTGGGVELSPPPLRLATFRASHFTCKRSSCCALAGLL